MSLQDLTPRGERRTGWQWRPSWLQLPANDLLRERVYRRLWISILISSLGSQITMLALPLTAAVLLAATPSQMGLLTAMEILPFVLLSLPSELRDAHERELVELYHQELVAHGVTYDRDTLWEDYRHSFMLVTSLLFLPLLGGEQTLDERNRAAATSIAMCWHARVVHALGTFDRDWVTAHYDIDVGRFVVSSEWIANHPHPWNSGARLVADELRRRARQPEPAGRESVAESD